MDPRAPSLSLCMISRDEAGRIGECLAHVRELVSEIVVVDTGSSDRTPEIARECGARVIHRPWDDDFSAPRNLSIAEASGEWILVLDADEIIDPRDHARLKTLIGDRTKCYELVQRHYTNNEQLSGYVPAKGEYPEWEARAGGYFETRCVRLFPKEPWIEFRGAVHELVEHSIRAAGRPAISDSGIRIHHFGRIDEAARNLRKEDLYSRLARKKIAENPDDWRAYYELGLEEIGARAFEPAAEHLRAGLARHPKFLPALNNLGFVLCELGRFPEARKALEEALLVDGGDAETRLNLGVIALRERKLPEAVEHFGAAIARKPDFVAAYCNLGKCHYYAGNPAKAEEIYRTVLTISPKCAVAQSDLGALYLAQGKYAEAEPLLVAAAAGDEASKNHYYLGHLHLRRGRSAESLAAFERFCGMIERGEERSEEVRGLLPEVQRLCAELKKGISG